MSARGHFSSDPSGPVMHGECMAFISDEESLLVVRSWAERQGFPPATVQQGGPDIFAQMLESSPPPKMAIVDIDGQEDPPGVIQRLVSLCGPETKIVAIGSANDVDLYRRVVGAGVVDYLVKPLINDTLNHAMTAALRGGSGGKSAEREARIIVIMGVRGGVGASSIAVNTGWLMAHELGLNGALLDLDLQFGTTSLALDLEPGRGLRDIVNSPYRVDGLMIASSMVAESDAFSVLGAEEAIDEVVPMDSSAITALLKEMRLNFDFIIVDMPRQLLAGQKRLLSAAHEIVLVTEMSLAGIRDTLRIKTALKGLDATANLTVVASRVGPAHNQVDAAAFEKGAQIKIDLTIPEDHKIFAEASNSGKPIGAIAKQAGVTKMMQTLAVKLSGTSAVAHKDGSLLKKLFSGGSHKKSTPKDRGKS